MLFLFQVIICSNLLFASGEFLKIGVGERPCGMGEAFGAVADNVNAIYWNPAGLSQITRTEFSFMHMQYVMTEFRVNYLGLAIPLDKLMGKASKGVLGFDFRLMSNEDTYRDENGNTTGKFMNYNGVGTIAYSISINKNYLTRISVKYFYEQYETEKLKNVLFDIGGMYRKQLKADILRLGMVAQNIGVQNNANNIKLGLSYQFSFGTLFALDIDIPTKGDKIKYSTGIEYGLFNKLSLRTGYRFIENAAPATGFTLGAGFKILKYGFDYSYIPYGDLGITHRISVSGGF